MLPLQSFCNTPEGHRAVARYLARKGRRVRVCIESTGVYGLDLALRRHAQEGIEVMVANPRAVRHFAHALLAELGLLAPDLDVRQWVAMAGLDPREYSSDASVRKKTRISKAGNLHLRRALYMPALVAVRHDLHLRAFYQLLIARGKAKLQALSRSCASCCTPSSACSNIVSPTTAPSCFPSRALLRRPREPPNRNGSFAILQKN